MEYSTVKYSTVQYSSGSRLTYEYEEGGQEEDDPQYRDDFYVLENMHVLEICIWLS